MWTVIKSLEVSSQCMHTIIVHKDGFVQIFPWVGLLLLVVVFTFAVIGMQVYLPLSLVS